VNSNFRLAALFCLPAMVAFAQSGAGLGSISGVVQDASGAVVVDATVVVSNDAKGIRRTVDTTSQGQFTAPALIPDSGYKVTVSKNGFANYEATNITVSVGQNLDLHVLLSVATTTISVDVSAQAIALDDTRTSVSQLINERQIMDLPTNGRRVDSFVLATPAVAPDGAFGLLSFRGTVRVYLNGVRRRGDPRRLPVRDGDEVVLEIGGFVPPHRSYRFPRR